MSPPRAEAACSHRGALRRVSRAVGVVALAGVALAGCSGGAEPAPTQPPAEEAAATTPALGEPAPLRCSLRLSALAGSAWSFDDATPGPLGPRVVLQAPAGEPRPLRARLNLNHLSETLRIPSSARDHLHDDHAGIWVEVVGHYTLSDGGEVELTLGDDELVALLRDEALELADDAGHLQLALELR